MDIKLKNEDKYIIIKHIKDKVSTLQTGEKIKLPNAILLELFFEKKVFVYQKRVETFFDRIDMTDFIKEYRKKIQILLGANCEASNIEFEIAKKVFLTASFYSTSNLKEINIGDYININNIPNINLSNNNFNGYEWQLDDFLIEIRKYVENYILDKYRDEIDELKDDMEDAFNQYGSTTSVDDSSLEKRMKRDIKILIQKIIPNLKNTKLRIKFDFSKLCCDDRKILEEILISDRFDGCYINSNDELYEHQKRVEAKQRELSEKETQYDCYVNSMLEQVDNAFSKKTRCRKI